MNIIGHVSRKMTAVIFVFHVKPRSPVSRQNSAAFCKSLSQNYPHTARAAYFPPYCVDFPCRASARLRKIALFGKKSAALFKTRPQDAAGMAAAEKPPAPLTNVSGQFNPMP
ncbi:hypothetical protein, partial [Oscillibacter sp.]|uniref:hypothetical protein n=1 Tax=Oscillibacter sp. TaxID=1945593 RepID=UPI0025DBC0E8